MANSGDENMSSSWPPKVKINPLSQVPSEKFEWTPELREIWRRGPTSHPFLGPCPGEPPNNFYTYQPGMILPEPTDWRNFLKWCGIRDEWFEAVYTTFEKDYPDLPRPALGYAEKLRHDGKTSVQFPVLHALVQSFRQLSGDYDSGDADNFDYDFSLDGFVQRAVDKGLRPEFAVFCGILPDEEHIKDDPSHLEEWLQTTDPEIRLDNLVQTYYCMISQLMKEKLFHEGKARKNNDPDEHMVGENQVVGFKGELRAQE